MTKKVKAIQGWYCTRCNHKIPDAQCSTLRVMRTGVCSRCANEYNGAIQFMLSTGLNTASLSIAPAGNESHRVVISC